MSTLSWIFLYLILPLGLGVLGNIATPWVKSLFIKGTLSRREKNISSILQEYKFIKYLNENITALVIWIARMIIMFLSFIGISVVSFGSVTGVFLIAIMSNDPTLTPQGAKLFTYLMYLVGIFGFAYSYIYIRNRLSNIRYFRKFRENTIKKLIKLGGNPEDLDKEEGS